MILCALSLRGSAAVGKIEHFTFWKDGGRSMCEFLVDKYK